MNDLPTGQAEIGALWPRCATFDLVHPADIHGGLDEDHLVDWRCPNPAEPDEDYCGECMWERERAEMNASYYAGIRLR